jgi:CO/xanthine dehydrogenase FAD-binding subunit
VLPEFSTTVSETKEEALDCLDRIKGARVVAGGTDLLVRMRRGEPGGHLVDVTGIGELKELSRQGDRIHIGAAVNHGRISRDAEVQQCAGSLSLACGWVGSPQIRNMGTIGGNLVNASPAADSIPPLLIHDATVTLESRCGKRDVTVSGLIIGPYRSDTRRGELLTSVTAKVLPGYREGYRRVAKRAAWAVSRLSIAWAVKEAEGVFHDVKLAVGSCTPMPFRPENVETFLRGREISDAVIAGAIDLIVEEIFRVSGTRPSFVYKIPVLRGLLERILRG